MKSGASMGFRGRRPTTGRSTGVSARSEGCGDESPTRSPAGPKAERGSEREAGDQRTVSRPAAGLKPRPTAAGLVDKTVGRTFRSGAPRTEDQRPKTRRRATGCRLRASQHAYRKPCSPQPAVRSPDRRPATSDKGPTTSPAAGCRLRAAGPASARGGLVDGEGVTAPRQLGCPRPGGQRPERRGVGQAEWQQRGRAEIQAAGGDVALGDAGLMSGRGRCAASLRVERPGRVERRFEDGGERPPHLRRRTGPQAARAAAPCVRATGTRRSGTRSSGRRAGSVPSGAISRSRMAA